jgi:hypothetical protein
MSDFKPTWLYIKQHNITGLKYFGKTIKADPYKYKGSGIVWTRHLNKHGNDVTTVWCQLFNDKNELVKYALDFSNQNKVVESSEWANLRPEDGLMGGDTGISDQGRKILSEKSSKRHHSAESKQKIRDARMLQTPAMLGKNHSEETKQKIRDARALQIITPESIQKRSEKMKGYKYSEARNLKISTALKGIPKSDEHKKKLSLAAKARLARRVS